MHLEQHPGIRKNCSLSQLPCTRMLSIKVFVWELQNDKVLALMAKQDVWYSRAYEGNDFSRYKKLGWVGIHIVS